MRARRNIKIVLIYALLIGLAIPFLLPFGWMVATSMKKS
jgi:ABC-type glycerol-3-phosphate transport system permease component